MEDSNLISLLNDVLPLDEREIGEPSVESNQSATTPKFFAQSFTDSDGEDDPSCLEALLGIEPR